MSEPTQPAPFSSAYIVTGEVVHCHTVRCCWECILGQCPGGVHTWADLDDIAHAETTGQPDPSDQRCGCDCTNRPAIEPCALCIEEGPMFHTDHFEEKDE